MLHCTHMQPATESHERTIRALVSTSVAAFASGFETRHLSERDDPDGTINMKVHNIFVSTLGADIQYYTALVRSFDSSLGNMLEDLAIGIAKLSFNVERQVSGALAHYQAGEIARIIKAYKDHAQTPRVADYHHIAVMPVTDTNVVTHVSDYHLFDPGSGEHYLIELKVGGDLDNKKARAEKEALLEQFVILSNKLRTAGETDPKVSIKFATGYNRYGEGRPWLQSRVRQFFADDELLIGRDFWNFVTRATNGYDIVIDEYRSNAHRIVAGLENVRHAYLDN